MATKSLIFFAIMVGMCFSFAQAQQNNPRISVQTGHGSWITSMKSDPDFKYLTTQGLDGNILLWEIASGKKTGNIKIDGFDLSKAVLATILR